MNLSPVKMEILETLLLENKEQRAAQIAKNLGKEFPATQMHLIGLTKMGLVASPQKGYYVISPAGKSALGLPNLSKENAEKILSQIIPEKAFHFYAGIGKPLSIYAHSLFEFRDKLNMIDSSSIAFHLTRGDFEAWFRSLGDLELAEKMKLLRDRKIKAEELSLKIREIIEDRCAALSKTAGKTGLTV
jgi:DNA-binding transcriptional ArsR family regulator